MKIAVDIDGVLADWISAFLNFSNVVYGYNDKPEDVEDWKMWECERISLSQKKFSDAFAAFNEQRRWQSIKPIEGAVETMCALDNAGHTIYYITARPKGSERATAKFLLKNGFPLSGGLIFSDSGEKANIAERLGIDIGIDDKQSTICEYYKKNITTILINATYNWNLSWEVEEKANFIVDFLPECVKIIERLESEVQNV